MESQKRPLLFTFWGIYFACAGFATLVSGVAFWHFGGGLPFLPAAYVGMNALLSRAFFLRERWLLPLLTLHISAYTTLFLATWLLGGDVPFISSAISTALAGGAWVSVYTYRTSALLKQGTWAGVACLVLWILVYTYTATVVLQ